MNHYNSLFLTSSHNFISPHFSIEYLKMPTNIAVITQEESEPKHLPNANPTMALPFLDPLFVPKFPKKKLLQMKLWAKQDDAPAPEPDFIQVLTHIRGSSKVQGYKYYTTPSKSHGNKKDTRS
jgi:hypothetical protein